VTISGSGEQPTASTLSTDLWLGGGPEPAFDCRFWWLSFTSHWTRPASSEAGYMSISGARYHGLVLAYNGTVCI
jgi:hypothetical protein